MKKKQLLATFVLGATMLIQAQASNVAFPSDTLNLTPLIGGIIPPVGGGDKPVPGRGPNEIILPTVVYDEGSLLFIGTGAASFIYEILDETDEICLSGELELVAEQEIPVSLSTLPAGDYTILLYIAGREYEGEFTIE